jgi:hypothetical protein
VNDRIKEAGQFLKDAAQESVRHAVIEHGEDVQRRGFSAAVGIALRRIDAELDALRQQMTGQGLTKADQAVYAQLVKLKSQVEADCEKYWRDSGVEWRPAKPVVKGVVRRTENPQAQD